MILGRLRWTSVVAPVVFLVALDLVRHTMQPELLHSWAGYVLLGGVVLIGALLFSDAVFGIVGRVQDRLAQRNRELLALHQAGLAITRELGIEAVLQRVVDEARELVGARYGALSVLGPDGRIELFMTSGITAEQRASIGPPPTGRGLLGVALKDGQPLRLPDLAADPRSVGFPANHPPMRSLLAVPVLTGNAPMGNLYLAEKLRADEFSREDEESLGRFATQAGVAIANARLHRQVRSLAITEERERIAREMHDSLAQVLGYVNTKAQAAQQLIDAGQTERASGQIGQLAEAARAAYVDVRENILALRTSVSPDRPLDETLRAYVASWQEQSGVAADVSIGMPIAAGSLSGSSEVQLMRIIQEALANVRKHSGATQARIRIAVVDGALEAVVEDNGAGFEPDALSKSAFPRFGLSTMRERAEAAGGTLTVESTPGSGTRIIARLPTRRPGIPLEE